MWNRLHKYKESVRKIKGRKKVKRKKQKPQEKTRDPGTETPDVLLALKLLLRREAEKNVKKLAKWNTHQLRGKIVCYSQI